MPLLEPPGSQPGGFCLPVVSPHHLRLTQIPDGDMTMALSPTWLEALSGRLFRMAVDARTRGETRNAEILTVGAFRCLDRVTDHRNASVSAPVIRAVQPPPIERRTFLAARQAPGHVHTKRARSCTRSALNGSK
jgi:hypothetical protein